MSFFVIVSFVLTKLSQAKNKIINILVFVSITAYIVSNVSTLSFLKGPQNDQITYSKNVADSIKKRMSGKNFNFATYPTDFSSEESFIYFLELDGYKLADRAKNQITNQMFVVCNKKPCLIIDSPSWNISMFGKAKIDTMWKVEDLQVYKLTHAK